MMTVWKFTFEINDEIVLEIPDHARLLHVDVQRGSPTLWALVNPDAAKVPVKFRLYGTGHPVDVRDIGRFVGTFQMAGGALVFHLWTARER